MMNAPDPSPVVIHHSTTFKYGAPVLCESKALTNPATSDPRYVTCVACLMLMSERQLEMRAEQVRRWG